ncbi:MAG TPA: hypothetical protein VMT62_18340 [Syntrophorhabdaceae bacterium]|nr:hypothetical protein [Syntrophorhabdaceae bacterium]
MTNKTRLLSEQLEVDESADAASQLFYEKGWTDGLPIVAPTEERVLRALSSVNRDPQELIATLPPLNGSATVEKIAVNAVMAGCLPEYLPVVIAAVESITDEKFGILAIQTTTHPCGALVVINGPIAKKLGINGGASAFGPGGRANATIGRALRLIMLNVGGAVPGEVDKSTQGQPAKYTYCVAENEEQNPWQPLHVERGFNMDDSTVTVFAAEGPHNIHESESLTGKGILMTAAGTMATPGNNNLWTFMGEPLLVLCPEHAKRLAEDGFSKNDIKDFIFEYARFPLNRMPEEQIMARKKGGKEMYGDFVESEYVPLAKRENIVVLVVGGDGKHSCFIPTFGPSYSATKLIRG